MFSAINKNTNKKVTAWAVFKNPSYLQTDKTEWIADPDCLNEEDYYRLKRELPELELPVYYVKESDKTSCNGIPFRCPSCFHFYKGIKEKYNINFKPESKEHKLVKKWIEDNLIFNENIILKYSDISKPFRYNNSIKLINLPIDYNKCCTEATAKGVDCIRIDVLLPFHKKDNLFGQGIAFEVQFSKQREKTELERTSQRIFNGFSVVWLHEKDFEYIIKDEVKLKINEIKIQPFAALLKYINKQNIKNLKIETEKLSRQIDEKINNFNNIVNNVTILNDVVCGNSNLIKERLKNFDIHVEKCYNNFKFLFEEYINNLKKGD
jgi:hypothetical protein